VAETPKGFFSPALVKRLAADILRVRPGFAAKRFVSMRAQYELTKRVSAEGSIRPYPDRYPERTLAVLPRWAHDANAHVRRLVSGGTRLRLPRAPRVPWLDAHPERMVELIALLKDDPSKLARRSVARSTSC
jgi:3-methyladenine DNA glycosylase AlkC